MDSEKREKRPPNPRASSNIFSSLFLLYMFPIFYRAFKRPFTEDDLYEPLDEHRSKYVGEKLERLYLRYNCKYKKWSLHIALLHAFGLEFFTIGVLTFLKEIGTIVFTPFLIGKIVSYFAQTGDEMSREEAFYYAAALIVCMCVDRVISHPSMMWIMHVAMKMRVACSALIYRKTLRLSKTAQGQTTVGQVVNLLSNDVSKFDQGFVLAHYSWVAPIQAIVAIFFLYREIGPACFFGVGFMLMFIPIQMFMAKRTSVLRLRTALRTDERVRLMNEIISGIQVIKMYTWEKPFAKLVAFTRGKEIRSIRAHKILIAFTYAIELFTSRTAIFLSLVSYALMGNRVTAEAAFGITAIYNVLKTAITFMFTLSITSIAEVNISIKRVKKYMDLPELPDNRLLPPVITIKEKEGKEANGTLNAPNGVNGTLVVTKPVTPKVILTNVSAKWNKDHSDDTLTDITLSITEPQLFAVIGPVGSGKSSLLNVLLSELPIDQGSMTVDGSVSFSAQEPWLFAGNVRQNILFGDHYDEQRYRKVCKVCQLESDFAQLPHGDKTLVGERGKTLSGGQKARVTLARCIYKKADIYLLDDPLSAVDANVGKKLYNDCIRGFLATKICILITHQLQYLKNADNILILDDGTASGLGTYNELQSSGLDFAKLLEEFQSPDDETEVRKIKSRQNSVNSENDDVKSLLDDMYDEEGPTQEKENITSGVINLTTYRKYMRAGGSYFTLFNLVLAFLAFEVISRMSDYYITYWVNTEQYFAEHPNVTDREQDSIREELMYEFTGISVGTILLAIFHNLFVFIFLMRASVNLHNYIFTQLAKAKMKFFNANPTGRILNRFSRDIGVMDEYLPYIITDCVGIGLLLFGTIVMTSIVNPMLLPPAIVLVILFYIMRVIYLKTSRSVKRIEGITRSPIFTQMTATMNGLSTIRAFAAEEMLIKEFDCYQDMHSSAWFLFIASTRAFGFGLDMICVVFISLVVLVLLTVDVPMYGGDLGLIITQYMGLMGALQWGMRQWSELENQMTSVERVLEYTQLENEPVREESSTLPKNWPEAGKLEFRDVSMRYVLNEPPVLKHLNFVVHSGEKIGIVGRTGAGKSSIIVSLFQLYELEGAILIDGVDSTKLPLDIVRNKVSIIPQEPILFSGTMRKNLDPFDEYSDDVLWHALEQVELKEVVAEMAQGLHTHISEGGSNYSVGQRQLVCLARAIIRNNKILVLDEATANVDPHTDALIQQTIRKQFADFTVLTIAHRLHTVMDSDKILVMDDGRVVEFDTPYMLLQRDKSIFKDMVETTGQAAAITLKDIAEKTHNESKEK